jgi:hypothetical protein
MPGENRFRIFGAVPPRPEGPSAKYSEPTHEDFQALLDGVDHVAPFVGRGSGVWDRWTEGRNPMPGSDQASSAVAASRTPSAEWNAESVRTPPARANGQPRYAATSIMNLAFSPLRPKSGAWMAERAGR